MASFSATTSPLTMSLTSVQLPATSSTPSSRMGIKLPCESSSSSSCTPPAHSILPLKTILVIAKLGSVLGGAPRPLRLPA